MQEEKSSMEQMAKALAGNTDLSLMQQLMDMFMHTAKVEESFGADRVRFDFYDNHAVGYVLDGQTVTKFFSKASVQDGRTIDTRTARRKDIIASKAEGVYVLKAIYEENGLILTQQMTVREEDPAFVAVLSVSSVDGSEVSSNFLAPLDFAYPDASCKPLFLSLDQKMLLVPYDNDMWVRYESAPLKPGRLSYDVTAVYNENTNEGLVIGALDYDVWKNAIRCSQTDARCYTALSGIADAGTHDICPHGYVDGKEVSSARFLCGWYEDIRRGMESFGQAAMEGKFAFRWPHPNPFGWNSYSAGCMTLEQWEAAGDFIKHDLPEFCDEQGVTYINLDANFMLDQNRMKQIVDQLHANGQKAGNYLAPLASISGASAIMPLRGTDGISYDDITMKDADGHLYPIIDSSRPVDITHPAAELNLRLSIRELVDMGFDYIKLDFLAHGSLEGKRYDPTVKTGRQALNRFYNILAEELDPEKTGRDIFVDLSIAPLFPGGYGHGRRCCCDAFGHHEDVRYVLNALNFGWWQSGTLYCYNDPDHTVLKNSAVDGRGETDLNSARSRYHASVISGTVMLLSDDFGPFGTPEAIGQTRERVRQIANNPRLNAVARIGRPFVPAYLKSDTTNVYFLHHEGRAYACLFNFEGETRTICVPAADLGMPETGTLINLDTGGTSVYTGMIRAELEAYDSVMFEIQSSLEIS